MTFRLAGLRPLFVLAATLTALAGINSFLTLHGALLGQVLVATVTLIGFYVASRERKRSDQRRQAEEATRRAEDAVLLERLHLEIELNGQKLALQGVQQAQHAAAGLSATREAATAAKEAFQEANGANNKIAALQQQLEERTAQPMKENPSNGQ